jgi:rubrerythrin
MEQKGALIKIFEYALNQEYTGKSFFEVSLKRMGMGSAISAFKKLIEEEEKHIEFITRIIDDIKSGNFSDISKIKEIVIEPTDYFDERAKKEFLEQCIEGSMVPDITVFNTAWLIEKDLSDFYSKMAQKTEGISRDALLMLSQWEKSHEKFFKQYRDKLNEVYSEMPWGG